MIYNNREYPHPVLGIGDSISGSFEISLSVRLGIKKITIEPTFKLKNEELSSLVEKGDAVYVVQVNCSASMYRKSFSTNKSLSEMIIIESMMLRERVEVDFFICASNDLNDYYNDNQHEDYKNQHFSIQKGDLLAYGGKGVFHATKSYAKLKSVSSFMAIDSHEKQNNLMYNFYDGDRITILLSKPDYISFQTIKSSKGIADILHSSIVLPALMEAINLVQSNSSEFIDKVWYDILVKLIEESKEDEPLAIAQKILENPINRSFKAVQNLVDYD